MQNEVDEDFGGLVRDSSMMTRRRALGIFGAAGLLAACGKTATSNTLENSVDSSSSSSIQATNVAPAAGAAIPSETQGPYPADGSNGPNVLTDKAIIRKDLTSSFGEMSGTAIGIPMKINLTVVDATSGAAIPGAAVYLWHCTADGRYSIYEVTDQNYLRGIQETDSAGRLTFETIFPGCYRGRWPHAHFEIFESTASANAGMNARKTSQLALPQADCAIAYSDATYGSSSSNLSQLSLQSDMVFADGWTDQLATVSGSASEGFVANLLVRV